MASEPAPLTLSQLLLTTKDGDWGKDQPEPGKVPYRVIRGADFPQARIGDVSGVPRCYLDAEAVKRRTLQADDIIIETAGGNRDRPTGRTLLVTQRLLNSLDLPATCASFCRFLRVNPELAEPGYIFWFLQWLYARGVMWEHQVQHTGVARFQYTRFAQSTVPALPSRTMQQAIAYVLSAFDEKIELNRRMSWTMEATARSVFKSWFIDLDPVRAKAAHKQPSNLRADIANLFPDTFDASELGEIPKGWRVQSLIEGIEVIGGGTPKTSVPDYWGGNIPWYSVVDAPGIGEIFVIDTEKRITQAGVDNSSTRVLPVGTTIISARGTVGKLALVGVPMAMNQSCYGLQAPNAKGYFLYFATEAAVSTLQQRTHGAVFDTITRDTLKSVRMVMPTKDLVAAYERTVDGFLQRVLCSLHQSRTLASLREALLQKLISGQMQIADAERIVARCA